MATLTLDHPHKGNGFSRQLRDELDVDLDDDTRVLIVNANGEEAAEFGLVNREVAAMGAANGLDAMGKPFAEHRTYRDAYQASRAART